MVSLEKVGDAVTEYYLEHAEPCTFQELSNHSGVPVDEIRGATRDGRALVPGCQWCRYDALQPSPRRLARIVNDLRGFMGEGGGKPGCD